MTYKQVYGLLVELNGNWEKALKILSKKATDSYRIGNPEYESFRNNYNTVSKLKDKAIDFYKEATKLIDDFITMHAQYSFPHCAIEELRKKFNLN